MTMMDNIPSREIPRNLLEVALRDPGLVRLFEDILRQNGLIFPTNIENAQVTADQALNEALSGFQLAEPDRTIEAATQPAAALPPLPEPATQPTFDPQALWPVGSVYITTTDRDPGEAFGFGKWSRIEGRFLVGYEAGDPDFGVPSAIGGERTAPVSAHTGSAVDPHDSHTHIFTQSANDAVPDLLTANTTGAGVAASGTTAGPDAPLTHVVTQPDDHDDIDILPPFLVVFMWRRDY